MSEPALNERANALPRKGITGMQCAARAGKHLTQQPPALTSHQLLKQIDTAGASTYLYKHLLKHIKTAGASTYLYNIAETNCNSRCQQ